MKAVEDLTIGIAGLGLMGGALARALGECGAVGKERLLGFDTDPKAAAFFLKEGVIGEGWHPGLEEGGGGAPLKAAMLRRCGLVFLCLNPSTLIRFLSLHMEDFKSGALITDIAGIKGNIIAAVEQILRPDLDFIPGHPMAGAEKGGYANAGLCCWKGKNYILTPLKRNRPENLEFLKALIYRMGFGRITCTTAADHDSKIAFTSQLCHVIAAALIDCEADPAITRYGGGSFEDLTRIAMLNAPMWTELFIENREALLKRIGQFEWSLGALKDLIAAGKGGELEERLRAVRERRGAMG
ncbi:MAG: prephenate dehydrogenase [Treponema sp.]|nr:prephenate dehydrogenase [Treponema sp.]